jgi:aspartate aminotransferase
MFENITAAPADPILGLADLFRADERPGKINLGIGVYKDETGKTPVLTSVKKASSICWKTKTQKITSASTVFLSLVVARRNCCSAKAVRLLTTNVRAPRRPRAVRVACELPLISWRKIPQQNVSG